MLGYPVPLGYPAALAESVLAMDTRAIAGSITLDTYDLNLPTGYAVITNNSWQLSTNKVSVQVNVYADEAAYLASATPIWYSSQSFDYDSIVKGDFMAGLYTALLDVDLFANCTAL